MPASLEVQSAKGRVARMLDIAGLVDEGAALDLRMKRDVVRMAEIKTALVEKGPGEYYGTRSDARALVIYPSRKIAPKPEAIEDIQAAIGKTAFGTLFDRVIIWKPAKACREIAQRVLKGAKLKKFFELAEAECPAQVRFG